MDFQYQPFPLPYILTSPQLLSSPIIPENYVHYSQTPESHIYSADLPGVRKEEIDESSQPAKSFLRKFRLPGMIDVNGISAVYEDGVLTVTVPIYLRRGFHIDPADIPENLEVIARAA